MTTKGNQDTEVRVWNTGSVSRVAALILLGWPVILAPVAATIQEGSPLQGLPVSVFFVCAIWVIAFRPVIRLTRHEMVVVNFVGRRREIAREAVSTVTPSYDGLIVQTRDGRRIVARAVQRQNWQRFLGRKGRADDIAREIVEWSQGHLG